MIRILILCTLIFPLHSAARIFDMNDLGFSAYFLANYGTSSIGQSAFESDSATTTTYNSTVSVYSGGEFGFVFTNSQANIRLGFEIFSPAKLETVTAENASSQSLYTFDSSINGYAPMLGLELNITRLPASRWFLMFSGGSATITIKNSYTLAAQGAISYPSVATTHDVSMVSKAATAYRAALAYERHFSDTSTWLAEFGYRSLVFTEFTYGEAVTTFQGAQAAGDVVYLADGTTKRTLDFTNYYLMLGFRIYTY